MRSRPGRDPAVPPGRPLPGSVLHCGMNGAPRPGERPPCSQGHGQKPLAQAPSRPGPPAVPGGSVASASQPRSLRTLMSPEQQPQPLGPRRALPAASRRLRPMPAPRAVLPRRCLPRRSLRPACQARRPLRGAAQEAACAAGARLGAKNWGCTKGTRLLLDQNQQHCCPVYWSKIDSGEESVQLHAPKLCARVCLRSLLCNAVSSDCTVHW
ncbi:alpha-2-macroglobulin-like protein 1-like [Platysternon megacephalum]|uniref:Alpha-2-macroglobulin-like protein 1-like n=1 Tax=Platysternon megacephalum TaxID=55544 RepID=A0A4D9DSJ3_9SAUR|nr:alpha-2-macroglobulin-like protein 1-like [Platysternon megacephalum]